MDRKEILNSPPAKFPISVYKIYLHLTPPPSGLYHMCLRRKQVCNGLLSQNPIKWVGLNVSLTSLIRKISKSKRSPAEKPPNEISNLESTDTPQP